MKEFERDGDVSNVIADEVDAILREIAEEAAAEAAVLAGVKEEPAVAEAPLAEEVPPAPTDAEATVLFAPVEEVPAEEEAELTDEQIRQACQQALNDLIPEEAPVTEKKKVSVKAIVLGAVAALLVLVGAGIGGVVGHISKIDTIYPNVSILGTDVGGMTLQEAEAALKEDGIGDAEETAVSLKMPGGRLALTYGDVGVTQTAKEIAQAAYDYGRGGSAITNALQYIRSGTVGTDVSDSVVNLPAESYIKSLLDEAVNTALEQLGDDVTVDEEAQTLTFVKGAARIYLNREDMMDMLMEAIETHKYGPLNYTPDGNDQLVNEIPDIYEKYCAEAQDAVYDKESGEVLEEVIGIEFDKDAAMSLWDSAAVGQTLVIPVTVTQPKYTKEHLEQVLFTTQLAESVTTIEWSSDKRKNNIRLACEALDGMVLLPGEQVDYNLTLGERTPERGYQMAGAYQAGEVISTYGGGICQVSSALYYCSLLSNLQIDERQNHSMRVNYMPMGYDATVSWGGPELKITNNREYPIRIVAVPDDKNLTVSIWGTDDGTYVELSRGSWGAFTDPNYPDVQTGNYAQATRKVYDSVTNELLSTEKMGIDLYMFQDSQIEYPYDESESTPTPAPAETPVVTAQPEPTTQPDATPVPTPTPVPTGVPEVTAAPEATPEPTPAPAPVPEGAVSGETEED